MRSDLSDDRRSGHARPSAGSLTDFVSYPSHLARVPSCLPRVHPLHGRHTTLPFVRPQSTDAASSHMPPPRDTKKGMPLSCLESPPIKEKTIKTRYEIKGNKKKNPGIPNHRPKRQERCPKYTRSASLRSLLTIRSNRYRLVSRGGVGSSSKKKPHPPKDDRQPREERQELPCGAATGEGLAGRADGECVNIREADVGAVEAVVLVNLLKARVVGLDKGDVDALGSLLVT